MVAPFARYLRMGDGRIVYSTRVGRVCPVCGWPAAECRCSGARPAAEAVSGRIVARLRVEKKGRGGKTVTVVYDLPNNAALLKDLAQELKRSCGTGGAVVDNRVELQGDLRERVREALTKKGWAVKG